MSTTTARDPYLVLGVSKAATPDEIKRAFRNLAKKYHPDQNKGDPKAEAKFKDINAAYDILSDADKRQKYDRGEIDAAGNDKGFARAEEAYRNAQRNRSGAGAGGTRGNPFGDFSAEDIFSDIFGMGRKRSGAGNTQDFGGFGGQGLRGSDVRYELHVPLAEAVRGGKRRVTLPTGKTIDVTIPPGTDDGQTLRLKGLGEPGAAGAGDALVEVRHEPHPHLTLKAGDIYLDVPISLPEAVSGATIKVPTLDGPVEVRIPPKANTGMKLRLKGKGAPKKGGTVGDQYLILQVALPDKESADLTKFVEGWAKKNAYNPRKF